MSIDTLGRAVGIACLSAFLFGCSSGSDSGGGIGDGGGDSNDVFAFETVAEQTFEITVTDDSGNPLRGARVQIADVISSTTPYDGPSESADPTDDSTTQNLTGNNYFTGVTNSLGVVSGTLRLAADGSAVDVIVNKSGYTGDYTVEGLRTVWSIFAPSSRTRVELTDLESVDVELEAE
ncbi:MAG: hypothetical protein AAF517_03095 [Planctomycetota bacterium]